jgi:hypothetical protein
VCDVVVSVLVNCATEIVEYYHECIYERICVRNLHDVCSDCEIGDSNGVREG